MHAEVIAVHICSDGHGVKTRNESLVNVFILELLQDFGAEGEVLGHGAGLVVATEHDYVAGEVNLLVVGKNKRVMIADSLTLRQKRNTQTSRENIPRST